MKTMHALGFFALSLLGAGAVQADSVKVARSIPWAEDAEIAGKIQRECKLQTQLAEFIKVFGDKNGQSVQLVDKLDRKSEGRVLMVEIRDAVSGGNAFLGHHKFTSVRGKLYENGRVIGNFKARRNSMGGAFGGYKGSCSVLGRTVKALGEDIAKWMRAPGKDAMLGDLE